MSVYVRCETRREAPVHKAHESVLLRQRQVPNKVHFLLICVSEKWHFCVRFFGRYMSWEKWVKKAICPRCSPTPIMAQGQILYDSFRLNLMPFLSNLPKTPRRTQSRMMTALELFRVHARCWSLLKGNILNFFPNRTNRITVSATTIDLW